MIRLRNLLPLATIVAGLAALAMPSSAKAAFQLKLQEDGGAVTTITNPVSAGPASFSGVFGDFLIGISFGNSNSPGGPNGVVNQSTISITNLSGATHTLHVSASAQDFTTPNSPPPLTLLDTVSGSLIAGTLTGDWQGYADSTNALFGTGFAGQLLTFSANTLSTSFSEDGSVTGFSPNGATYSISVFGNLTLAGGTSVTLAGGNAQTLAAVPAPAGLILALTGLPVFGAAGWMRRRRAVTA